MLSSTNCLTCFLLFTFLSIPNSFFGADIIDVWLPASPDEIFLTYSLHIFDPFATAIDEEVISTDKFIVYPNPTDNVLSVKMADATSNISYQIFGLDGKLIAFSNSVSSETGIFTIDISGLISGLYYLNITNYKVNKGVKFVKN